MSVIYFTADLMATSKISGAATSAGIDLKIAPNANACQVMLNEEAKGLLVDLNQQAAIACELIRLARSLDEDLPIIAHGPHVQEGTLQLALDAGATHVVTNGQLHRDTAAVLAACQKPAN